MGHKHEFGDWRRWLFLVWLIACAFLIAQRWGGIHWYALPDTDDNIRMAQVRALLNGQDWYDLRQHALNPPQGYNIHWSRLVDLPIAALQLLLRPFLGAILADKWSAGLAPLIPFGVAMAGSAVTLRRLIAPGAFILAPALMLCAPSALGMFMPLRVDHHGWQLAMLAWTIAGLVDPAPQRGGLTMGVSSALSLVIGLELLPFLAVGGGVVALLWIWDAEEGRGRLRAYAAALALGCLAGYAAFASYDNRVFRCDVLSPVWLLTMVSAGVTSYAMTVPPLRTRLSRLVSAGLVAALLAAGFALAFPHCLGAPEQISPELYNSWFKNIREAKPLYQQNWQMALNVAALPVIGLIGALIALREHWGRREGGRWAAIAFVSALSLALCLWQTRNGPGAQMLAIPGAAALAWMLLPLLAASDRILVRGFGVILAALVISSLAFQLVLDRLPAKPVTAHWRAINRANSRCPTLPALNPIARLPKTTIFTFVDLGPRLINVTHHRAIAGPYHRNGDAILDVHHAFDGPPERARAIMLRHGATLLLVCPNLNESTVYRARSPDGFYARLARGQRLAWLTPLPLPKGSPYRLWRIAP